MQQTIYIPDTNQTPLFIHQRLLFSRLQVITTNSEKIIHTRERLLEYIPWNKTRMIESWPDDKSTVKFTFRSPDRKEKFSLQLLGNRHGIKSQTIWTFSHGIGLHILQVQRVGVQVYSPDTILLITLFQDDNIETSFQFPWRTKNQTVSTNFHDFSRERVSTIQLKKNTTFSINSFPAYCNISPHQLPLWNFQLRHRQKRVRVNNRGILVVGTSGKVNNRQYPYSHIYHLL